MASKQQTPVEQLQEQMSRLTALRAGAEAELDAIQDELSAISGTNIDEVQPLVAGVNDRAEACRIVVSNLGAEIDKVQAELTEAIQQEGHEQYVALQAEIRLAALSALDGLTEALQALNVAKLASVEAASARKKWKPSSVGFATMSQLQSSETAVKNEVGKLTKWIGIN